MIESLSRLHFHRSVLQARTGRISEAIQSLTGSLRYDPDHIEAWTLAGLCYYRLGLYTMARRCWNDSLHRRPEENVSALYLAALNPALEQGEPWFKQAEECIERRAYGRAAEILEGRIIPLFGPSDRLLCKLGLLKALEGQITQAAQCWEQALTINLNNTEAERYLDEIKNRPPSRWGELRKKLLLLFSRRPTGRVPS